MIPLLFPLVAAMIVGWAVTGAHRWLPPAVAARMGAATLIAIIAAAVPSLWLLSAGFLAHAPLIGDRLQWCAMVLGVHHQVPAILGAPATLIAGTGLLRVVRLARRHRHVSCHEHGAVEVTDHAEAYAITMPGRGGRIIVSQALIDLLDDDERAIVLAHEQAHARHRHDRFLLVSRIAAAAVPGAAIVSRRVHFAVERWADEIAAQRHGDRRLVATTLAKVALHSPSGNTARPAMTAAGFAGLGVPARVAALLQPRRRHPRRLVTASLWMLVVATVGCAVVQLHHLGDLIAALCRG